MIKVEIDSRDLQQVLHTMPAVLKSTMEDALAYAGNKFMKNWHTTRFQGGEGVREFDHAHGLFSRFRKTVINEDGNMGLRIKASNKVAYKLEHGYTQTTTSGFRKVAVPLTKSKEAYWNGPDGPFQHKYWAGGTLAKMMKEDHGKTRYAPIRFKGQWYVTKIRRFKTKKDALEPMFVLKDKVVVKPRLGFYSTFESMRLTLWNLLASRLIRGVKQEWSRGEVSFSV